LYLKGRRLQKTEQTYKRSHDFLLFIKYYSGGEITFDEVGRTYGTYRKKGKRMHGFGGGNLKERGHLDDISIDGRIIFVLKK
jgi:hypothetical protein